MECLHRIYCAKVEAGASGERKHDKNKSEQGDSIWAEPEQLPPSHPTGRRGAGEEGTKAATGHPKRSI